MIIKADGTKFPKLVKPQKVSRGFTFFRLQDEDVLAGVIPETQSWVQPKVQSSLDIRHNFNCEVCLMHGTSADPLLQCIYCNVVCHVACLRRFFHSARYDEHWICFYCVDYLDNSRKVFEQERKTHATYHLSKHAQIVIAREWRRFAARKHYLRIYLLIVRLQVMFHVRRRKKMFMLTLQNKLRPMKLRIMRCHGLVAAGSSAGAGGKSPIAPSRQQPNGARRKDNSFYVLVTVMDTSKATVAQTLRIATRLIYLEVNPFASFDLIVEERMMLPGVSGNSVVVLSVLQRGVSKDVLLGQISLDLGPDHLWKRGGHFSLNLSDQEYAIKDHIGMDMKTDTRFLPCGSIDFELMAFNGMTSECGYCYATNADDLVRTLAKLPDYKGFIVPSKSNVLNNGPTHPVPDAGGATAKKAMGSSESYAISMKKIWIVIAEGLLYIYSHFGDQLKVAIDISAFTYSFEYKDYGRILLYKMHKAGYPDFLFHTTSHHDTLRWKCAFLCSVRSFAGGTAVKGLGPEGFDMMALLQDLWMMESLKPNSGLMREAHEQAALQAQRMALRASTGDIQELAKIFTANGGTKKSLLLVKSASTPETGTVHAHSSSTAHSSTAHSGALPPVAPPANYVKGRKAKTKVEGIVDRQVATTAPVTIHRNAGVNVPQQQIFIAAGAQLLSDQIQEENALDDIMVDEKYQKHGETFVKFLMTSIAEKKRQLRSTRSSNSDLRAEYGLRASFS